MEAITFRKHIIQIQPELADPDGYVIELGDS